MAHWSLVKRIKTTVLEPYAFDLGNFIFDSNARFSADKVTGSHKQEALFTGQHSTA